MHSRIMVNLPVADVGRSRKFFTDLGYALDEKFCDDRTLAVVLGENQFDMLTQADFLDSFHPVKTADASKVKECVICLSADSLRRSTRWWIAPSPPAAQPATQRITASCTAAATTTGTAARGRSSGWPMKPQRSAPRRARRSTDRRQASRELAAWAVPRCVATHLVRRRRGHNIGVGRWWRHDDHPLSIGSELGAQPVLMDGSSTGRNPGPARH